MPIVCLLISIVAKTAIYRFFLKKLRSTMSGSFDSTQREFPENGYEFHEIILGCPEAHFRWTSFGYLNKNLVQLIHKSNSIHLTKSSCRNLVTILPGTKKFFRKPILGYV